MRRHVWSIADYTFEECIYKGPTSNVFKAICNVSGMSVVVKVYKKAAMHSLNHFQVRREMNIHSRIQHPNIIDLYGCFESDDFFVLLATGGDLFEELRRRRRKLTERETLEIVVLPLLHALNYLHQRGILHRDLKPENLLLTHNMVIKVCDFGLAIDSNEERPVTRLGTMKYMPPEIIVNPFKTYPQQHKDDPDCLYDEKVDVWSMAIMVYEVLYGSPTFGRNKETLKNDILEKQPNFSPELRSISNEAKEFLSVNLSKNPADRMSVREMFNHPWCRLHYRRSITLQRTPSAPLQAGTESPDSSQAGRRSLCGMPADSKEADRLDGETGITIVPTASARTPTSALDVKRLTRHSLDSRASGAAYAQRSVADVNPRLSVAAASMPRTISSPLPKPTPGPPLPLTLGPEQVAAVSIFNPRRADALPALPAVAENSVQLAQVRVDREGKLRRNSMSPLVSTSSNDMKTARRSLDQVDRWFTSFRSGGGSSK
eukprot:CAMPEP_0177764422 /NCGR_PEP_ID=MMETSP0491_2-20121128/7394_1 /TAXON_ID=63592 /ORGANISM="Tetraselmis chuii, Strain PLY429" /LENGTH=487 /DNA_ID=CAMNT_0019280591 /DNA_START=384 /DNA_END=1848 /DNA_ORIENTATION=+